MRELGKLLLIAGLALVVLGAMLWAGVGKNWLGKLPGDIHYRKDNLTFYFPIVTCLLLSVLLTVILWLFRR